MRHFKTYEFIYEEYRESIPEIIPSTLTKGGGSPQLYYHDCKVPGHTTRAPPVGFELATNYIQLYAIANLDKTSLSTSYWPSKHSARGRDSHDSLVLCPNSNPDAESKISDNRDTRGNLGCVELDTVQVGRQFEPYRWSPCGVTWDVVPEQSW